MNVTTLAYSNYTMDGYIATLGMIAFILIIILSLFFAARFIYDLATANKDEEEADFRINEEVKQNGR